MDLRQLLPILLLIPLAPGGAALTASAVDPHLDPDRALRGYVGAPVCGACHPREHGLWRDSYHDRAMQPATEATVLGDFADAELEAHGIRSRFSLRDGAFVVRTDGPDGELHEYQIRYTFGWWPLQQYLIEFPGGRLQSLGIAWDSRDKGQGGQRWLHLYPDEPMDHRHPLHWTAPAQTWNHQCADCHSTDVQKRYDSARDSYDTRYAEIDVACEACHGPGAGHVDWARAAAAAPTALAASDAAGRGLLVDLGDRDGGVWQIDSQTGQPRRSVARAATGGAQRATETCARCHARRGRIWDDLPPGAPLHQGFRLARLDPDLYFPDGQIKDEVFDFGSFIQSRMHRQGVVCTDCHEPHSLAPRAAGNALCTRCHMATRYDDPGHHHHRQDGPGAACIACHMPQRRYMLVDDRADHSLRVPRPDLSVTLGTPNACNGCHLDQDAAWAAAAVADWFPEPTYRGPHFATALHAADRRDATATVQLLAVAADPAWPAIARASALDRLHDHPHPDALPTIVRLLADPDAQVRAAAVRFLDLADLATRAEHAWPLLADPARTVRLAATPVLAPLLAPGVAAGLRDTRRAQLEAALAEAVAAERVNADRPEAHLNIGLLAADTGDPSAAEQAYRMALRLDPRFVPAYANLADLYRALGRDPEAIAQLRAGLAAVPDSADLHHALGLAEVRAGRPEAALAALGRAAALAPEDSRYAYVYGIALDDAGRTAESLPVLAAAQLRDPADRDILIALIQYNAKLGHSDAAAGWLAVFRAAVPDDPALAPLAAQLGQAGN